MDKRIRIKSGQLDVIAELNDTNTAQAIWEALPIKGRANTWGDEIYFTISVSIEQEAGQELVEVGELGYWPLGQCIAPMSHFVVFGLREFPCLAASQIDTRNVAPLFARSLSRFAPSSLRSH